MSVKKYLSPFYLSELLYSINHKGFPALTYNNFRFFKNFCDNVINKNNYLVLDVGANDGWFSKVMLRFSSKCRILAFEPLPTQHNNLELLKKKYPHFKYKDLAIGDKNEKIQIKEYESSGLSSIKNISPNYSYNTQYFSTAVKNIFDVECVTLDSLSHLFPGENIVLKIDTQGFEMEVLKGSEQLFQRKAIKYIIIECSSLKKYEGQSLAEELISHITAKGFEIFDINPFYYEASGQLTEFDIIFKIK